HGPFTGDYRNRLTDVGVKTAGGATLTTDHFTYDVFDHRIGKSVNGTTTWTLYAGDTPYADFNSTGSVLNRYLADPRAIDAFFARTDGAGNNTAWYLADMLGSVREIVNTSGTVLDDIRYASFRNILSQSSPSNGDRFKFAGMQWDSEIGQYYVWHRDYLAGPGRFETEDPLGLGPDANAYRYVGNNPVDRTDPTGLFSFFHFDEWIRQKVEQ